MPRFLLSTLPAALSLLCAGAFAQVAPAAPPTALPDGPAPLAAPGIGRDARPAPLPRARGERGRRPVAAAPAATTRLDGRVARWLTNPNGEVDGLLLADGTQVAFPPHLGGPIAQIARTSDTVQLTGWRDGTVFRAAEIRNAASGRSVRDDGPPAVLPAARAPVALQPMAAAGRIDALLRGPAGDVNGVLLSSGEQVRFPPHVGVAQAALLTPGAMLHARGYGTRNAQGASFEATALGRSADSLQEVFAGPPGGRGAPLPPPPGIVPPTPPVPPAS